MLSAFSEAGAEFLIVGAHALAVHARPRATGHLDLWIRATAKNASRVWSALEAFGAPLEGVSQKDLSSPGVVVQIGFPPRRIDILTSISGVEFDAAWRGRVMVDLGDQVVPVIGHEELVLNKRATGRLQDLADLEALGEADAHAPEET